MMLKVLVKTLLMLCLSAVCTPGFAIVTFTVDSALDEPDNLSISGTCHTASNKCTLRAAIMQANRGSGAGAIVRVPSGIYTLTIPAAAGNGETNGDLNITAPIAGHPPIAIIGAGVDSTIVDANQIDRIFSVEQGRTVAISGMTLRNGFTDNAGGGIYNEGDLTLTDAVVANGRSAGFGGGIFSSGSLQMERCTVSGNVAFIEAGGVELTAPSAIRDSTISDNHANNGGGIYAVTHDVVTPVIIVNSTISQNYALTNGGGVYAQSAVFAYSTSIVDNDADHDRDETGGSGGGIFNSGFRAVAVNSLIARNTRLDAPIYDDCDGTIEIYGYNRFGDVSGCTLTGNGALSYGFITLATIGALQNNGGPTKTHALLDGSQAIDSTYTQGCIDENGTSLVNDQRGARRPVGLACDIGAFEYGSFVDLIFKNNFE
jgi:predicted outer membrane repeat protein